MSISNDAIQKLLNDAIPNAEIAISGDGYKYEAHIVSDAFEGLNTMKRHQLVYGALNDAIASGELHALTIKAFTPAET